MIDADRFELVDTGDGVPLTKCEQNLYEALANVQDLMTNYPFYLQGLRHQETVKRLEDALEDMGGLVAEVERLRKGIKAYLDLDIETSDLKRLNER